MTKFFVLIVSMVMLGLVHDRAAASAITINTASCTGKSGSCGYETPTSNSNGALLSNDNGLVSGYEYVSTNNGNNGAGQIAGDGGTDGSAISTNTFTLAAGQSLSLYFDFASSDTGYNSLYYPDYAWAELVNASTGLVGYLFTERTYAGGIQTNTGVVPSAQIIGTLAATIAPTVASPSWDALGSNAGTCWAPYGNAGCGYSGWNSVSTTVTTAGNYYVSFGVTNVSDTLYQSALAVANIVTTSAQGSGTTVPEPVSIALLCSGLMMAAMLRRRSSHARF